MRVTFEFSDGRCAVYEDMGYPVAADGREGLAPVLEAEPEWLVVRPDDGRVDFVNLHNVRRIVAEEES